MTQSEEVILPNSHQGAVGELNTSLTTRLIVERIVRRSR